MYRTHLHTSRCHHTTIIYLDVSPSPFFQAHIHPSTPSPRTKNHAISQSITPLTLTFGSHTHTHSIPLYPSCPCLSLSTHASPALRLTGKGVRMCSWTQALPPMTRTGPTSQCTSQKRLLVAAPGARVNTRRFLSLLRNMEKEGGGRLGGDDGHGNLARWLGL